MPGTEGRSLLNIVRKLVPQIRSCADEIEATRELPRPLFEALADAGLFHLALPRTLGCPELDLPTYIQVIEELGKADASTAWAINQGTIFATYAARMPHAVARGSGSTRHAASSPTLPLRVRRPLWSQVDTWSLAAKASARAAGMLPGWPHMPRLSRTAAPDCWQIGQPETRYLFVPVAEAELLDTWHVRGLRGTGTHHFAIRDVFVPAERSLLASTAPLIETGPLYQIPRTLVFASGDAAVALGTARACLTTFLSWLAPRPRGLCMDCCAISLWSRRTLVTLKPNFALAGRC